MNYTERVQTLLTASQLDTLKELAAESGSTVSALIREAVESTYLAAARRTERRAALERLMALNVPAADWEQMEDEIESGAAEELSATPSDQVAE